MIMTETPAPKPFGDISNEEIGDFAEGQETKHSSQRPNRFSEGQETTPDDAEKRAVGDFATGEEKEHEHHIGTFASGEEDNPKS
jgi:hypothetical protein